MPSPLYTRLTAFVDAQAGSSEHARLTAAGRKLGVSRDAVRNWIFGRRSLPPLLDGALNWATSQDASHPTQTAQPQREAGEPTPAQPVTTIIDNHDYREEPTPPDASNHP